MFRPHAGRVKPAVRMASKWTDCLSKEDLAFRRSRVRATAYGPISGFRVRSAGKRV